MVKQVHLSARSRFLHPRQAVASVAGMGDGWDLGLTDEQRKARRPSIELRKSL